MDGWAQRFLSGGAMLAFLLTGTTALGAVAAESQILEDYQFDTSSEEFVTEDPYALWEYGFPAASTGQDQSLAVWSTGLSTRYIKDARSLLISPPIHLGGVNDVTLLLNHAYVTDVATGDCAAALARDPFDDDVCADGGLLRLRSPNGVVTAITPDTGYDGVAALDGQATPVFAGDSQGYRQSWFDLLDRISDNAQLELLFTSNSQQTSLGLGWYVSGITVYEGDHIPPQVDVPEPVPDTWDVSGTYRVKIRANDNRANLNVNITWWTSLDSANRHTAPVTFDAESGLWIYEIPGQPSDTTVYYQIEGVDANQNRTLYPFQKDPLSFVIQLPPPTGVSAECPTEEATGLRVSWKAPNFSSGAAAATQPVSSPLSGDYPVDHYVVMHLWTDPEGKTEQAAQDASVSPAIVPAKGYPWVDTYQVQAVFRVDDGSLQPGGWSKATAPCQVIVPRVTELSPRNAWQGTTVELTVIGEYTRFSQADLEAELGEGITVTSIDVIDVNEAILDLEIDEDAPLGDHALTLTWPGISVVADPVLQIAQFEERPRITAISPARITQKEQEIIKFTGVNTDFKEGRLAVQFGPGITVGDLTVRSNTEFEVPIEAASWAPFGPRTITVVSGELSFNVDFRVDVQVVETDTGCSFIPSSSQKSGPTALLMSITGVFFLLHRRRSVSGGLMRGDHVAQPNETHTLRNSRFPLREPIGGTDGAGRGPCCSPVALERSRPGRGGD